MSPRISLWTISSDHPYSEILRLHRPPPEHDENLRLWQSFTSDKIPLDDIEDVVYGQSWNAFFIEYDADPADSANLFYLYLTNTGDQEVISFLGLAKRMEAKLSARRSPWYYPAHRDGDADPDGFEDLIRKCKCVFATAMHCRLLADSSPPGSMPSA